MADFSTISSFYDLMTGYSLRLVNDFGKIKHLVNKFNVKNALDAGCGSGVHTIILAKIGVEVLGFDASREMLELARTNALKEGVKPRFEYEYFETIPEEWWGKNDAVFCLANSLGGVINNQRLSLAMRSFQRSLKKGGSAIIQVLNTPWFKERDQRIIKVSSEDNFTFVRFFDFDRDETRLNVVVIEHNMGEVKHQFISSSIMPLSVDIIKTASEEAGFSKAEFYSDLVLTVPFTSNSRDIVAVLTK
jgi:ubiquinone/menaquinone biosynthesis C-methylase UbiE